jgi:hypothetical protein
MIKEYPALGTAASYVGEYDHMKRDMPQLTTDDLPHPSIPRTLFQRPCLGGRPACRWSPQVMVIYLGR